MRKLWYAGAAIAGGVLLLGASPAQAAPQPGGTDPGQPASVLTGATGASQRLDDALGYTMNKTNGIRVSTTDPLGPGAPVSLKQGQSSANVGDTDLMPLVGDTTALPGALTAPNESDRPGLPSADVVGGALPRNGGGAVGGSPLRHVPARQVGRHALRAVLPGGLPILGGLQPDGRTAVTAAPTTEQARLFDGGMPLLGGLGGLLPANELPRHLPKGYTTGLPAGGMTVAPATAGTAAQLPAAAPAVQDPRLHEEPLDDEAGHRSFSGAGRPVAGVDPQYR